LTEENVLGSVLGRATGGELAVVSGMAVALWTGTFFEFDPNFLLNGAFFAVKPHFVKISKYSCIYSKLLNQDVGKTLF
jgi:hypothetical protein